ncbi:hypothetical protein I7I53_01696 [Histoplasma capsulatum var. duboisii H88]|uniref:Uncharacterized protein n=1 Tax=Ajellomyces capsulatus (strain H88) TaxID=544711 RepID=A0A8A1LK32_AJEC8|nr:hypothetical protein I7I53_01696 [Histoplasma capsulatum var. duboisii H88]
MDCVSTKTVESVRLLISLLYHLPVFSLTPFTNFDDYDTLISFYFCLLVHLWLLSFVHCDPGPIPFFIVHALKRHLVQTRPYLCAPKHHLIRYSIYTLWRLQNLQNEA